MCKFVMKTRISIILQVHSLKSMAAMATAVHEAFFHFFLSDQAAVPKIKACYGLKPDFIFHLVIIIVAKDMVASCMLL